MPKHNAVIKTVDHRVKARNGWATVNGYVVECACGHKSRVYTMPEAADSSKASHNAKTN